MKKNTILLLAFLLFWADILSAQRTMYGIRNGWVNAPTTLFSFPVDNPANTADVAVLPFANDDLVVALEGSTDSNIRYLIRGGKSFDATVTHAHELFEINLLNGTLTSVATLSLPTGVIAVDLAWDATTNQMYLLTGINGLAGGSFRTIDINTGAMGTPVTLSGAFTGLAVAATFDTMGNFYVMEGAFGDDWHSVNLTTGNTTDLGGLFFDLDNLSSATVSPENIVYLAVPELQFDGSWDAELYSNNLTPTNAVETLVGLIGDGGVNYAMQGMTIYNPDFDAEVADANVDLCSDKFTKVVAQVRNAGTQPISGIEIGYVLDGGNPVVETVNATIAPFATIEYEFSQTIDISDGNDHILDVYVSLPNDENSFNDATIGKIVNNTGVGGGGGGTISILPYLEDFETDPSNECTTWLPDGWTLIVDPDPNFGPDWNWTHGTDGTGCFAFDPGDEPVPPHTGQFVGIYETTGDQNEGEILVSPSFNLAAFADFTLTYDAFHFQNSIDPDMGADVRVSVNGGNWVVIDQIPLAANSTTWTTDIVLDLSAYALESDVRIGFYYTDGGGGFVTVAVDNIRFTGTPLNPANTTATTPLVEEQYVPQGTPHHIIYETTITSPGGLFLLNDFVFTTNGSYRPSDINTQGDTLGFRLWWSADSILGPGDPFLGRVDALESGSTLPFNCMAAPYIEDADTLYLFLTADIAPDAVDERTIWVEAVTNDNFGTIFGTVNVVNSIPSERQIIGTPPEILGDIFMADLFTPNGDNRNDNYTILGGAIDKEEFSFKIFDRNGKIVYETTVLDEAINEGWDGKVEGEDAPNGVYLWSLDGRYLNGEPLTYRDKKTGVVRLLR